MESVIGLADELQSHVIGNDLLHNEDRNGLGQLAACFHDPQTQGDDLRSQKKVNHFGAVVLKVPGGLTTGPRKQKQKQKHEKIIEYLHQGTDNTEAGQAEEFKGAGLAHSVQEGIQKQGDMGYSQNGQLNYC